MDSTRNQPSYLQMPISIWVRKEEWAILHRCKGCGIIHSNRIASDDNEIILLSIATQAIARPSFFLYEDRNIDD